MVQLQWLQLCASSLALMAAGVPIKRHVAGIALGLIIDKEQKKYKILTDIQRAGRSLWRYGF